MTSVFKLQIAISTRHLDIILLITSTQPESKMALFCLYSGREDALVFIVRCLLHTLKVQRVLMALKQYAVGVRGEMTR